MILTKEQVDEYGAIIYAARGDTAVVAFVDITKHHLERVKGELIDAKNEDTLRLQGEAQAYRRLLKFLTSPRGATL